MMGAARPLLLSAEERHMIAYHEGGHALVALLTPGADGVRKVTIVPRGQALGVTQIMPVDDRHNYPRSYLLNRIAVGLGGRVAEQVALGEITTGAENDLQNVSNLAREMVTRWGMSGRIGTVFFGRERDVFLGREMSLGSAARLLRGDGIGDRRRGAPDHRRALRLRPDAAHPISRPAGRDRAAPAGERGRRRG